MDRKRLGIFVAFALVLSASLAAVGCGGGSGQRASETPPATTATATDGAIPATATEPLGDVDRRWLEGFREATDPMDEQLAPIGSGVSPVEAAAAAVIVLGVCETTTIGIAPSAVTQAIEERWTAGCDAIGNGYDLIADGVNTGDQSKVDDGIATFNQGVEVAGSALARADELLGRSRAGEVRAPDEDATPETEPTQAAPVADGRFSSTCDYVLGDFTESSRGFRFVANADLKNTGGSASSSAWQPNGSKVERGRSRSSRP